MADEDTNVALTDAQYLSEISNRDSEVTALLAKKSKAQALQLCLQNPPISAKSAEVKVPLFYY